MDPEADHAAVDPAVEARIRSLASQLEQADFELVEPPPQVWDRIEASLAAGSTIPPKEPPWRERSAATIVEYRIDADDVLVDVGRDWAGFAQDNDASGLANTTSGRTLWSYFDGDETRELWRLVVARVRSLQQPAEVPLRCDAPDARRWFDMTVSPEPDGGVQFRCVLTFEEARPFVSLLDAGTTRDVDLGPVPLCSWCGRGQHGDDWLEIEELVRVGRLLERESLPPISFGICGPCRDDMSAELLVPGRTGRSSA